MKLTAFNALYLNYKCESLVLICFLNFNSAFAAETFVSQKGCWVQFKTDAEIKSIKKNISVSFTDPKDSSKVIVSTVRRIDESKNLLMIKASDSEGKCPDVKVWKIAFVPQSVAPIVPPATGAKEVLLDVKKPSLQEPKKNNQPQKRSAYFNVLAGAGYQMTFVQSTGSPKLKGLEYNFSLRYEGHGSSVGPVLGITYRNWKGSIVQATQVNDAETGAQLDVVKVQLDNIISAAGATAGFQFALGALPEKSNLYFLIDFDYGVSGKAVFTTSDAATQLGPYKLKNMMRSGLTMQYLYKPVAGLKMGLGAFGGAGKFQYNSTENSNKFNYILLSGFGFFGYEF